MSITPNRTGSAPMFTERAMSDRLLRIFDTASAECVLMADWYRDVAARDCSIIADESGVPYRIVVALAAVLSPGPTYAMAMRDVANMCMWHAAGRTYSRPACSTYGPNVEKADRILATNDCTIVSGPKVTAYERNILGEWDHVTLDRHAVRPISKSGQDIPISKAERARMEAAYRKAAARRGLKPAQFQAVVWCAVRGAAE